MWVNIKHVEIFNKNYKLAPHGLHTLFRRGERRREYHTQGYRFIYTLTVIQKIIYILSQTLTMHKTTDTHALKSHHN